MVGIASDFHFSDLIEDIAVQESDILFDLNVGWNLIGYSSDNITELSNALFHDGTTQYTWANAIAGGKQQAYLSYLYCSRLSFPVFRPLEYESFRLAAFAIAADISSVSEKNFYMPA